MRSINTVKELKEFLEQFEDEDEVLIPCEGSKKFGYDWVKGYNLIVNPHRKNRRLALRN